MAFPPALGQLVPGHVGVVMVNRLPSRTGLVHVGRIESGADLVGHVRQLDVDSTPFAVGVRPELLLRRQRHLGGAVSLAHQYLLVTLVSSAVSGGGELLPVAPIVARRRGV